MKREGRGRVGRKGRERVGGKGGKGGEGRGGEGRTNDEEECVAAHSYINRPSGPLGLCVVCLVSGVCRYRNKVYVGGRGRGFLAGSWDTSQLICQPFNQPFHSHGGVICNWLLGVA